MEASLLIRPARAAEVAYIVDLIDRVQQKLIAMGSLQQIGPIPQARVAEYVASSTAFVLEEEGSGKLLGSVFVRPVTAESLAHWQLADVVVSPRFLHTLALEPEQQGRGLGLRFLAGLKQLLAQIDPRATIVLDCWEGNTHLRDFYTRSGFNLHGVFSEEDYGVAVFTSTVI